MFIVLKSSTNLMVFDEGCEVTNIVCEYWIYKLLYEKYCPHIFGDRIRRDNVSKGKKYKGEIVPWGNGNSGR